MARVGPDTKQPPCEELVVAPREAVRTQKGHTVGWKELLGGVRERWRTGSQAAGDGSHQTS